MNRHFGLAEIRDIGHGSGMPDIEHRVPPQTPKSLTRKMGQSAVVWSNSRAGFMRLAIPKLERAIRSTNERLQVLHDGIDVVTRDGQVVRQVPDDMIVRMNGSLVSLIETTRQLLGFPNPGRRANDCDDIKRAAHAVIADVTSDTPPVQVTPEPAAGPAVATPALDPVTDSATGA